MKFRTFLYVTGLTLFFSPGILPAQELIPLGTWRSHIAYDHADKILVAGNRIYCLTDNGLFYFDKTDNSLGTLSKVNGLSDVIITAAGYSQDGTLVLGYDNGNLDIISGNTVKNFTGIRDTPLNYSKEIKDIIVSGNRAYLATDYGIIVFDLAADNIFETWHDLGPSAESLPVNAVTILNNIFYAATDDGIISGSLSPEVNLVDYTNWKRYGETDGLPAGAADAVAAYNNEVIASLAGQYIYALHGDQWVLVKDFGEDKIVSLSSSSKYAGIVSESKVNLMDGNYNFIPVSDALIKEPKFCTTDADGSIFIADGLNGMVTNASGDFRSMYPDGPFIENVKSVSYKDDRIIILPPGIGNSGLPSGNDMGFSVFENGSWESYNNSGAKGQNPGPPVKDLVSVDYDPNSGTMIFASYGYGLLKWDGGSQFTIIDENTPGSALVNANPPGRNTLVSSVNVDGSGDLYMLNDHVYATLVVNSASGSWSSYDIPDPHASSALQVIKMQNGQYWIRPDPSFEGGIIVFDPASGKSRTLTSTNNEGGLPGDAVNDMMEDMNGMIWVATDQGVAYFPLPEEVMTDASVNAVVPVFDNRYLLRGENITCLAVDGGNDKWVGTDKGAWLFNEDGSKLLTNFNASNSPLFSDVILDIGINGKTGEVFFSTDKGLLSWRGTATVADENTSGVKIFPNPVAPDFTGLVGISGLPSGAIVKITTVNGLEVYETVSQGGTASWNTRDVSGRRVQTGVYMVFTADPDGKETYVGKLAVIR